MNIEICANSSLSAWNALQGGASRVELCRRLDVGGLTPYPEDLLACAKIPGIRTHVLIRPRAGDFCYSPKEFSQICQDIILCRRVRGVRAVVVGFLTPDGYIDEERTREIVQLAAPMEVTFHRAFDEIRQDPAEALASIIRCGCHRLLTSGCAPTAEEGIPVIRSLEQQSQGRILIMAGAGITPHNAPRILADTAVPEIHASCQHTLPDGTVETDAESVRELLAACNNKGLL